MRGNCFESQQIWWSEIRADDGGGGVIRIRVGGRGLERVEGGGGSGGWRGVCAWKKVLGGVRVFAHVTVCVEVCIYLCV